MARRLNEDHSDHSGSTTACACGQTARYAGRRPKTFTSVLGPLTLEHGGVARSDGLALAHVVPNKVEAAYARSDLFERRRLLMADWAEYLEAGVARADRRRR